MQLAVKYYKDAGGRYIGGKSKDNSLAKWSRQDWRWSGKKGQAGVYLPKRKIAKLKSSKAGRTKLAKAARIKSKATREGRQYARHGLAAGTSNPPVIAPPSVARTARSALARRRERSRLTARPGGTAVGVARARDLANGRPLSERTLKRMRSFFARHDTPAEQAARARNPYSPASIAWDLWGGNAGRRWVETVL